MKKSLIYGVVTVLIWSTMAPVVKSTLTRIPNMEALTVSSLMACLMLLFINIATGKIRKLRKVRLRQIGHVTGLGFIGLFLYSALYYRGLSELSSQEACVVNYLWPIMIVVFSILILKEKLTLLKVIALLCSFAGIVILSLGEGMAGQGNRLLGILCCLGAAVLYGLFSVLNKKLDYDQSLSMMVFWFVTAVCSAVWGLARETWVPIEGSMWIGLSWMGIASYAVAYLLWALALRGVRNTAVIANLAFLTPFLSVIWSAVFLKEPLQVRAVIALVLIVGGILIQNLLGKDRQ